MCNFSPYMYYILELWETASLYKWCENLFEVVSWSRKLSVDLVDPVKENFWLATKSVGSNEKTANKFPQLRRARKHKLWRQTPERCINMPKTQNKS